MSGTEESLIHQCPQCGLQQDGQQVADALNGGQGKLDGESVERLREIGRRVAHYTTTEADAIRYLADRLEGRGADG